MNRLSDGEQEKLARYCSELFYKCNIPFRPEEDPYLADGWLDNCLERTVATAKAKMMNSDGGVLLLDGWKNFLSNTKNVVGLIQAN